MRPRYGNLATGLVAFDDGTNGCYPYAPLGRGYRVDTKALAQFNRARALVSWLWPLSCGVIAWGYLWPGLILLAAVLAWHHFLVTKLLAPRPPLVPLAIPRWAKLQATKGAGGALCLTVLLLVLAVTFLLSAVGRFESRLAIAVILLVPIPYLLMVLLAVWKRTANP